MAKRCRKTKIRGLLRRGDKDFSRAPVLVKPDRQVPFVPAYEMMDYRFTLVWQAPSDRLRCHSFFDLSMRPLKLLRVAPIWRALRYGSSVRL